MRDEDAEMAGTFPGCGVVGSVMLRHDGDGVLGFWEDTVEHHADEQGHIHERVMHYNGDLIRTRYAVGETCESNPEYVHVSQKPA